MAAGRGVGGRVARTLRLVVVIGLVAAVGTAVSVAMPPDRPASAAVIDPFAERARFEERGNITLLGNASLTCDRRDRDCRRVLRARTSRDADNDDWDMRYVDRDASDATYNSSSAQLAMPPGSEVLFAGLYWGAMTAAGNGGTSAPGDGREIGLRTPTSGPVYTTLAADEFNVAPRSNYQGFADITDIVADGGAGTYWVGNLEAATGRDRYGGWAMVVAYANDQEPLRSLVVADGFAEVGGNDAANLTFANLFAPPSGPIDAEFGFVAYDGDFDATGDGVAFNNRGDFSDDANPSNNIGNSTISQNGVNVRSRDPDSVNNLGIDIDLVDADRYVWNYIQSVPVNFRSSGELFYPGVATVAMNLYQPRLGGEGTKSVVDLNGGSVAPGDTLEYTIRLENTGSATTEGTEFTDPIPDGATYVPGSMRTVASTADPTHIGRTWTDSTFSDDIAQYDPATDTVTYWGGAAAQPFNGGSLRPGEYEIFAFRVTVDADGGGDVIANQGSFRFRGRNINGTFEADTNEVASVVANVQSDLAVAKTDTIDPVVAGAATQYLITVANNGPSIAADAVLTDDLPTGMTFDASLSDPACSAVDRTVTCELGSIASGASRLVTIAVAVDASAPAGEVTNAVSITSVTSDANAGDNVASETTTVVRESSFRLDKAVAPNPATAGSDVGYTITAHNDGPSDAGPFEIVDTLPNGLTVESTSAGCAVSGSARLVTCAVPGLAAGASTAVGVTAALSPDVAAGSVLANGAVLRTADGEVATAAVTLDVQAAADLSVSKSVVGPPVVAGRPAQFDIAVTNDGPSASTGAVLVDTLPTGFTFDPASSTDSCTADGRTVTCEVGVLGPGTTESVAIGALTDSGLESGDSLTNVVSVTSDATDPEPADNSVTIPVPVERRADLRVVKTAAVGTVPAGADETYTITVTNRGPSVASAIELVDVLPDDMSPVSITVADGNATCDPVAPSVTCDIPTLDVGESAEFTLVATVDGSTPQGTLIANSATATGAEADPVAQNNTGTVTVSVTIDTGLTIVKDDLDDPAIAGGQLRYLITVGNLGTSDATNVVVDDVLPTGLAFVAAAPSQGTCSEDGAQPGRFTCQLGTVAGGATATIELVTSVDPSVPDDVRIQNVAEVSADASSDVADDSRTLIVRSADLAITKSAPPTAIAGGTGQVTLTVSNDGPSDASGVAVGDVLPSGMTATSVATSRPSDSCSAGAAIECTIDQLAAGETITITADVAFDAALDDGAALFNTASVSATEDDPDPSDDSAGATTLIERAADVSVALDDLADPVQAGATVAYRATVSNAGPSFGSGIVVVLSAAAQLLWDEDASTGDCTTTGGGEITCTIAEPLAPGTSAFVDLVFEVPGDIDDGTTLSATATTSATESDPAPGDETDAEETDVIRRADVAVEKVVLTTQPMAAGTDLVYRIAVRNAGPAIAEGVMVTDPLPAGTTFVVADAPCTEAAGTVSCDFGQLTSGERREAVVTVEVDPAFSGTLSNVATVSTSTTDPEPANDVRTATATVRALADISLVKTAATATVDAGADAVYTLTVRNDGPSDAFDVTVTDTLPEGLTFVSTDAPTECVGTRGSISCTRVGPLPVGATTAFAITARAAPSLASGLTLSNDANATAGSDDPDPTNNRSATTVTVSRTADLRVEKTASRSSVIAGNSVAFDITVTNDGPSDATNLRLLDVMSTGFSLAGVSIGDCAATANGGTCDVPSLAAGDSFTFRVEAYADPSLDVGTIGSNAATITADETDPDPGDNTSSADVTVERLADLGITAFGPATALAGETVTYTGTVFNDGPSDASDVVITVELPEGGVFVPDGSSTSCALVSDGIVTCPLPEIPAGEEIPGTIVVALDPDLALGPITGSDTVTSAEPDPDLTNNGDTVETSIGREADLRVGKSNSPDPVAAGTTLRSTIEVTNLGPSSATDVELVDALPTGVTVASVTPGAPDCTPTPTSVSCALARIGPDETVTVVVDALVAADVPAATVLTDDATATAEETDPVPGDNDAAASSTVTRSADVSIAGTVLGEPIRAGGILAIDYDVVNDGPSLADGVALRVGPLPSSVTLDVAASSVECALDDDVVECDAVSLEPGAGETWIIALVVDPTVADGAEVEIGAEVVHAGDTDPTDNVTSDVATVTRGVDLSVVKFDDVDPVDAGTSLTYTVIVANSGPSAASDVEIVDTLPDELQVDAATLTAGGGTCDVDGATVTCNVPSLDVGESARVEIDATVLADTPEGTLIENTASASSTELELNDGDNRFTHDTRVTQTAGLTIDKDDLDDPAVAGGTLRYLITVENLGPSVAGDVVIDDQLPAGLTFVSATTDGTGSCDETAPGSGVVQCQLGSLAVGTTTIELVTAVDAAIVGGTRLVNTVDATSSTAEPAFDNSGTTIVRESDLVIDKAGPTTATAGEVDQWVVTVTNNGPSVASSFTVDDDFPVGITATGVTTDPAGAPCIVSGADVVCTVDELAPGESIEITATGRILSTVADGAQLTNVARIVGADGTPTATSTVTIARRADVSITKDVTPSPLTAGDTVTYDLAVRNDGPSIATGVGVLDSLPDGVTPISASTSAGTCAITGQSVSCEIDRLAVGAGTDIQVVADTGADLAAGTTVVNEATVSHLADDPDPSNDTVAATATVTTEADLQISLLGPALATAGTDATYQLVIVNAGPSDADDVVVTHLLPVGVTLVPAETTGACTPASASELACDVGRIAAGSATTVTVTVEVDATLDTGTELITNATVASPTADPDPDDDAAALTTTVERISDLSLTKIADLDEVVAGGAVDYAFAVTNLGPSVASGVVLTDLLPPNTTDGGGTGAAVCTFDSGLVTCDIGELAPGETFSFIERVAVDPTVAGETVLRNTATVASESDDDDSTNNVASESVTVYEVADLDFDKINDSVPLIAGDVGTFTLRVNNLGPSVARDVVVSDPLPTGLTLDAATTSSGCAMTAGGLRCDIGDLDPATTASVVVGVRAASDLADGAILTNTASAASSTPEVAPGSPDPDANDNTAAVAVPIARAVDLIVTKTDEADPVVAGLDGAYTVTVDNLGPSAASSIQITDALPPGLTTPGAAFVEGTGTCTVDAGTDIACTVGALPVDDSVTIRVPFEVVPDATPGSVVTNRAVAAAAETDIDAANDEGVQDTSITRSVGLDIVKTVAPSKVIAGESVEYTVTVDNLGPSAATDVVITDQLPAPIESPIVTLEPAGSGTCTISPTDYVECEVPAIPVGDRITVSIDGSVAADTPESTLVLNTATVGSLTVPTIAASAQFTVVTEADVSVTKSAPVTENAGETVTYTVTVDNAGPSLAEGVVVTDALPSVLTGVTGRVVGRTAACSLSGSTLRCPLGSVEPGVPVDIEITGRVPSSVIDGRLLTNTARVTTITDDPNDANDASGPVDTTIGRLASLSITKIDLTDPSRAGDLLTYRVRIANDGPSDTSGVVVTDSLPGGTTYLPALSSIACTVAAAVATCPIGTISAGAVVNGTIVVRIDPTLADGTVIENQVVVSANEDEDTLADNTASATTTVRSVANLSVQKVADPPLAPAGGDQTWSVTVTNNGPSAATAISLTDALPDGTTFVAAGPGCEETAGVVSCAIDDLAPLASTTVQITAALDPSLTGTLTNRASVSSGGSDPRSTDDTGSSSHVIGVAAELTLAKSGPGGPAEIGDVVEFALDVGNLGPSTAANVRVVDSMPAGLTFDPASSSAACSAAGTQVTCVVGALAPGATTSLTVAATVDDAADGATLVNTATVTSGTPGDDPSDSTDAASVTVVHRADLTVEAVATPPTFVAGEASSIELEVSNAGPQPAIDPTLTVTLPPGFAFVPLGSTDGCSASGATVTCDLADLDLDGTVTVTIGVSVASAVDPGAVDVTARVGSVTSDPDPSNDLLTLEANVDASADLRLEKRATTAVVAGTNATYRVTVTNAGPSIARDVVVVDTLPDGMSFVTDGSDARCTAVPRRRVECRLGDVPVGVVVVRVRVAIDPAVDGVLVNRASVTASTPDPTTDDLAATDRSTPARSSDVGVALSSSSDVARAGETLLLSALITNNGPSSAIDATVVLDLPDGLLAVDGTSLDAAEPAGSQLAVSTPPIRFPPLEPGQTRRAQYRVTVVPGNEGKTLTAVLRVASLVGDDEFVDNNRAEVAIFVPATTTTVPTTSTTIAGPEATDGPTTTTRPVGVVPATGSSPGPTLRIALLVLVVGAGLVLLARRRRAAADPRSAS